MRQCIENHKQNRRKINSCTVATIVRPDRAWWWWYHREGWPYCICSTVVWVCVFVFSGMNYFPHSLGWRPIDSNIDRCHETGPLPTVLIQNYRVAMSPFLPLCLLDGGPQAWMAHLSGYPRFYLADNTPSHRPFCPRASRTWPRALQYKTKSEAGFPGGSGVKNLPANAGDMGSIPDSERLYTSWSSQPVCHNCWACALESLGAVTTEPMCPNYWKPVCPRTRAPQQEKLLQWETRALQLESSPCSSQVEKSPLATKTQHS